MIQEFSISNTRKDQPLKLSLNNGMIDGIVIEKVDGLGPIKANLSVTDFANVSGGIYNSGHISYRNLVFNFILVNDRQPVEEIRNLLYGYFPINTEVTIEIKTDTKRATISGIVESNEPDIFLERAKQQVSILCPEPFFIEVIEDEQGQSTGIIYNQESIETIDVNTITIDYKGEVSTGYSAMVLFEGDEFDGIHTMIITNGSGSWDDIGNNIYIDIDTVDELLKEECKNYKDEHGEITRTEGVGYPGDYILLDTENLTIKYYDSINFNIFSILGALDVSAISGWPKLVPGYNMDENTVTILPLSEKIDEAIKINGNFSPMPLNSNFSIAWRTLYEGM